MTEPELQGPNFAINPPGFPHVGYSNAITSDGQTTVWLAGQIDMGPDGKVRNPGDLVAQVDGTFANIVTVLKAAEAKPIHITRMRIFVLDADAYGKAGKEIGALYRKHFGKWFPAMTLVQVSRLFDPEALIEIEVDAVI